MTSAEGASWALGYDIGGTSARAALFARPAHGGELKELAAVKRSLRQDTSPEAIAALLKELAEALLSGTELELGQVSAIGLGLAAQLDPEGLVALNAPNLGWRDVPIAELARRELGCERLSLCNDLNAMLYGEWLAGAARGAGDLLCVCVGTGVGGAILWGGEPVLGAGGQAGEIGHVKVESFERGRLCGCGERGCVEAYAGGAHLEREIERLIHATAPPWRAQVLVAPSSSSANEPPAGVRVDLAAAGLLAFEQQALATIFDLAADHLARVIANACTLLNPERLLLGGGVLERCAYFNQELLRRISPQVLEVARRALQIVPCELGERAALLGAAALGLRHEAARQKKEGDAAAASIQRAVRYDPRGG